MRTLIRNGSVVTATGVLAGDVLIQDERIAEVAPGIAADTDLTYDAAGKLVIPGGIDVHTHLDMPYGDTTSADDFASGTIAAAFGGTTSIVDFAVQSPGGTLHQALENWMQRARGNAAIDYGFHMIVTDLPLAAEREMDELIAEGVTSFKLFMAYPGRLMVDDATIFRVLLRTAENGGTVMMHAENGGVIEVLTKRALAAGKTEPRQHALTRPALAEAEATHRAIALAEMADAPVYIVHVSAAEAVDEVAAARARGLGVYAETCPQYLFLTAECEDERYVMSPPLRDRRSQERLWRALAADELQVVATDHCPFRMKDKRGREDFTKIPGGAPGIETRMSLLFDGGVVGGRFGVERFVELTATNPAKLFGLFPRKGTIAPGSDADIVVWDPEGTRTISAKTQFAKGGFNVFEGRTVKGIASYTVSNGKVVFERGQLRAVEGAGKHVDRPAFTKVHA